ncbi:hypothetical protein LEP1GSC055_2262 [Leptospira borgpetersenii str. Brem 307]|uniref:Uncharacterized protein n=1 Tax=Leptospira borgpetersenii str. Brem 328 TaxID=1049780 RepID=A0ABC9SGQ2_LEPBO|nr:hypothetical protein LEP1GSC055_2262 [Leptospira borgpetersenii str. Brem 307]EMN16932.1 hypothetical protein LEP1GSC056_2398 [Leptospira borgpetersenii str. Brem 328]
MNFNPEIFICGVFLFLSSILFWLASTTIVNLERRDRSATFTIFILISVSALFGFFFLGRPIGSHPRFQLFGRLFFSGHFRTHPDSLRLVFYRSLVLGFFKGKKNL